MDSTKKKYILIFGWKEAKQKIKTASKDQNAGRVETKWRKLRGMETVSRGLEVILQIWRLGGHFCGLMAPLHPLPHMCSSSLTVMFERMYCGRTERNLKR